jgi:hypothetical protein
MEWRRRNAATLSDSEAVASKINTAAAPYAAPWIKMMIHAQERPTSGDRFGLMALRYSLLTPPGRLQFCIVLPRL